MASQKEDGNSPAAELNGMEYCDLTDKEFKIVLRISASHRKTQKGNLVKSEIKLMNGSSTLTKRMKL